MTLQEKYKDVLQLTQGASITEDNGVLKIEGAVDNQYTKNYIWNAIKAVGGDTPSDIQAQIDVANTSYYAKHVVQKGESLSLIAKHYYGDMMKYNAIFEANKGILKSADVIEVGQELVIPNA